MTIQTMPAPCPIEDPRVRELVQRVAQGERVPVAVDAVTSCAFFAGLIFYSPVYGWANVAPLGHRWLAGEVKVSRPAWKPSRKGIRGRQPRPPQPPEVQAQLVALYTAGVEISEIKGQTGLSYNTIAGCLRQHGIQLRRGSNAPFTDDIKARACALIDDGMTQAQVALTVGCSVTALKYWLNKREDLNP